MPRRDTFATRAPIEMIVNMKENINMQQLGQNAALAILRTGTMFENFERFVNIVTTAAKKPIMKANPIINVAGALL